MLRNNLSTRPFYNDRAVRNGLGVVALLAIGLTIFNAIEILRLESAGRDARQLVAQNAVQAREMREKAAAIRRSINQSQLAVVQAAAREANVLIDRRAFSWTALLNYFQATLPADVRVTGVQPRVDSDGRMLVQIALLSRTVDDRSEFMDALEATRAFSEVLSQTDSVEEDGTLRSDLHAFYHLPPQPAAGPPPPSSEQGTPAPANLSAGAPAGAAGGAPAGGPSTLRESQGRPEHSRGMTGAGPSRPFDKLKVVPSGVEGRATSRDGGAR